MHTNDVVIFFHKLHYGGSVRYIEGGRQTMKIYGDVSGIASKALTTTKKQWFKKNLFQLPNTTSITYLLLG